MEKQSFMKICNKAKDVSSNSTSNGQNAVHCEHANWEYTACSQNQSDCGICKRLPPHALQKKTIHNFTGNVSITLLWPVAFYRDYAEFVCCFVHVTKKDLQIKDALHLILLLNKQNFIPPPFNNNNMRISNVTKFLNHLLLSSIGTGVYITYSVCKFENLLNSQLCKMTQKANEKRIKEIE